MKKVLATSSVLLVFLVLLYSVLVVANTSDDSISKEIIGWSVTYIRDGKTVEKTIHSFGHVPRSGFLHFYCRDSRVIVSLRMSEVLLIEQEFGNTSNLYPHERKCVVGNKIEGIRGTEIS